MSAQRRELLAGHRRAWLDPIVTDVHTVTNININAANRFMARLATMAHFACTPEQDY
jgi:hypothetical protein